VLPDRELTFGALASRTVPLSRSLAVEGRVEGVCVRASGGLADDCFVRPGAGLRFVHVGRRNRHRWFAEAGLEGADALGGRDFAWSTYAKVGIRSRSVLIALKYSRSLSEYTW
jgi:hypothetical protein